MIDIYVIFVMESVLILGKMCHTFQFSGYAINENLSKPMFSVKLI